MGFYNDMRATADSLLSDLGQGTIEIGTTASVAGATPLDPPTVTTTWVEYNGVARGVSSQFVDNLTILATDLMAMMQADALAVVGGLIRLDGTVRNIVRVDIIPAVGTIVAKRVFIR